MFIKNSLASSGTCIACKIIMTLVCSTKFEDKLYS